MMLFVACWLLNFERGFHFFFFFLLKSKTNSKIIAVNCTSLNVNCLVGIAGRKMGTTPHTHTQTMGNLLHYTITSTHTFNSANLFLFRFLFTLPLVRLLLNSTAPNNKQTPKIKIILRWLIVHYNFQLHQRCEQHTFFNVKLDNVT